MRLESFRVQNYKKIADTGWVAVRDLTVLVGKNEAGKSAILRGLSKLNPSDGEAYDALKEFPRRRFSDEFEGKEWPVASGRFALDDAERAQVQSIAPPLKNTSHATITRYYSGKTTVAFSPDPGVKPVGSAEFVSALEAAISAVQDSTAPEGRGDELRALKEELVPLLQQVRDAQGEAADIKRAELEKPLNEISRRSNEKWQQSILNPASAPMRKLVDRATAVENMAKARKWAAERLPKFIYFDRYDVLDSAVHLPTFVQQLSSTPNAPRVRTTLCLFRHVGLDVAQLQALGQHQPGQEQTDNVRRQIDERAIRASSASNAMTTKFESWWEQRKHKFRYDFDGDYFRVWVSDDLDPSEIELDQRSAGMQYFFSFYTVFLVEAEEAHEGAILLLDEPALQLHGTAQYKIVEFLEKLSVDNQIVYTTHSPFMIDGDHLERARAVYEDESGSTRVSDDVWPKDRDSLFPLQAALGYQLAQSLFIGRRQCIVEGITDYWLLKALSNALVSVGRIGLRDDVVLVPSAGLTKLLPLASMLIAHDAEVAAVLDGDEPGRREGKKLTDKLFSGAGERCVFVGDYVNGGGELEDIFPEDVYLKAVKTAYPAVELKFTPQEKALPGVVDRLSALFSRKNVPFEKWRPAAVLRDDILGKPEGIPSDTLAAAEKVFTAVNAVFNQ